MSTNSYAPRRSNRDATTAARMVKARERRDAVRLIRARDWDALAPTDRATRRLARAAAEVTR